jgi:hypothetical protein
MDQTTFDNLKRDFKLMAGILMRRPKSLFINFKANEHTADQADNHQHQTTADREHQEVSETKLANYLLLLSLAISSLLCLAMLAINWRHLPKMILFAISPQCLIILKSQRERGFDLKARAKILNTALVSLVSEHTF